MIKHVIKLWSISKNPNWTNWIKICWTFASHCL